MTTDLARLPLHERHAARGARFVPFAGYEMPIRYGSIVAEHQAVRERVGLFDVSHMGEIELSGPRAGEVVNHLVTNDVRRLSDGEALYTVMCHPSGGIVDDLLVYRLAEDHYLCCVNASNRAKDFAHMAAVTANRCTLVDRSFAWVQLALQGPHAEAWLAPRVDTPLGSLRSFTARWVTIAGARVLLSRTGYTGEDGFELYCDVAAGTDVFDALVEAGADDALVMVGLAARDTLRLEARLLLYGNDLSDETTPLEAGLGWTVKLDKGDFVGREALLAQKEAGVPRALRGFIADDKGILRAECGIYVDDVAVGHTTSGAPSPTLGGSVALGYVDAAHANATRVAIDVRGRRIACTVTTKPFYTRPGG